MRDRIWGKEVIKNKLKIVYEPDAVVFHHHGIHQEADKKKEQKKIVQIMEEDEFKMKIFVNTKEKQKIYLLFLIEKNMITFVLVFCEKL